MQAELNTNLLTEEQIVFWINRFKGGDMADKAYQRAIIDIFVNAVYIFDDKIVLTYNFKNDARVINKDDIEISDLSQSAPVDKQLIKSPRITAFVACVLGLFT